MSLEVVKPKKTNICYLLSTLFFILISNNLHAQCAGNDAELTVCDIANPSNQAISLFDLLGPTATPGGIWSDSLQTGSLNTNTGLLNIWNIYASGTYTFTYTVSGVNGCVDNNSIVTVTVGGYSGIPSPNGSACSDDDSVNLFSFFVGQLPSPHLNGVWHDDDNTGALSNNILDATASGLGTFSFTYTMPALGSCPETSSTVSVTVYRAPEPGQAPDLILCNTDDLSQYSNLDLTTLLVGEDPNGQWSEPGTGQLSGPFDSFINVQDIYNTFHEGTYSFTYTVYPTNPICTIKTATVRIIIEKQLDFTGASFTVNSDICEDEIATATYSATLSQGNQSVPDGDYQLTYSITGANTSVFTVVAPFASGMLSFPISATSFQQVGDYTIRIFAIKSTSGYNACENIINVSDVLHVYPLPKLTNAILAISPVCKNSDVIVQLSGITNWTDGQYILTYNLTGSNTAAALQTPITVVAGTSSFSLPGTLVPNPGNTTITITNVIGVVTNCSSPATLAKAFVINDTPNVSGLSITINDACKNQPVTVSVSGLGTLTNVSILYNLTSANTAAAQSVNLAVSSGNASFVIPNNLLPNTGNTVLIITSLSNTVTTCETAVNNVLDTFEIHVIPAAPVSATAVFCKTDNATIANLQPSGTAYKWYSSATSTTPLANDTGLVSGTYFVSQTNGTSICESERTMVSVTVNVVPTPILNQNGQQFCGTDNPTIQDLDNNVTADGTVTWYTSSSGGTPLPNNAPLQQGATYYALQYSDVLDCNSSEALAVTVDLTVCSGEDQHDFFIPDGFSPNGDTVNDTFRIPDIEFLFPNYTFEIYNRYGNLMFKGNKNKPAWDGRNSESSNLIDGIAPNGVYFYIVYFNKDNAGPKQGRLYLNR